MEDFTPMERMGRWPARVDFRSKRALVLSRIALVLSVALPEAAHAAIQWESFESIAFGTVITGAGWVSIPPTDSESRGWVRATGEPGTAVRATVSSTTALTAAGGFSLPAPQCVVTPGDTQVIPAVGYLDFYISGSIEVASGAASGEYHGLVRVDNALAPIVSAGATIDAAAKVIRPLSVEALESLALGTAIQGSSGLVTPDDLQFAGSYLIQGEPGQMISVSVQATSLNWQGSGGEGSAPKTMALDLLLPPLPTQLDFQGKASLRVGGSFTAAPTQMQGDYTSELTLTVNY